VKIRQLLLFAGTGLLAGVIIMLAMAFLIFPAVMGSPHFSGSVPDLLLLGLVGLPTSVAALVGGLVGGRVVNEGARSGQIMMAIIVGALLALPVSCVGLWVTAW